MRLKICIFCLICAFFFGCDDSRSAFGSSEKLSPLPCDLNSQVCEKEFNGTKVKFEISPKPILAMEKHIFKISNLNANFKNPEIVFKGVNMYMGDIASPLQKDENGEFKANFMLSFCTTSVMRYRAEIYDNKEPTGYFIEFDVIKK